MLSSIIHQLVQFLAATPLSGRKIYVEAGQQAMVFDDLQRALNPAAKKDAKDIALGTPVKKEVTKGTLTKVLETGNPASIGVKTIEIATIDLKSDVLILKVDRFKGTRFKISGKQYDSGHLEMEDGETKITGTGRTLFSEALLLKGDGIPVKSNFVKADYPPSGLIVVLYRAIAANEAFLIGDTLYEGTTTRLVNAGTSATLLHELFVHAIPAAIADRPFYEDNYPNKALAVNKDKIDSIDRRGFGFSNK